MTTHGLEVVTNALSLGADGGIERCTLEWSRALAARGHAVTVFHGQDGALRSAYESAGVALEGPFSFGFSPSRALRDLRAFLPAARRARLLAPDVLWLQRPEHLIWAQSVAAYARTPIVCHLHHLPNPRAADLARGVSHFIAVSDFMRDVWIRKGIDPARVTRVHNAVPEGTYPFADDSARRTARVRLGLPQHADLVLYYGRVVREKGVLTLLEAFHALRRRGREEAVLVLVGSPDPRADPDLAPALARLDEVRDYRWYPAQDDVVPFLHAADVVVAPSWVEEAFCRVVLEGMATGRPVVASRIGGVPEILRGRFAEHLVEPRDAAELSDRLESLLGWRSHRPGLARECAHWARSEFDFSTHVTALERVLQRHSRSSRDDAGHRRR